MSKLLLMDRLRPIAEMEVRVRRARWVTGLLAVGVLAAALGLFLWSQGESFSRGWLLVVSTLMLGGGLFLSWLAKQRVADVGEIARDLEASNPDLKQLLLTAVEQEPGEGGRFQYLQERVIGEAIDEAIRRNWVEEVSMPKVRLAERWQLVMLAMFTLLFGSLIWVTRPSGSGVATRGGAGALEAEAEKTFEVEVDPGDVSVEVGTRLVVQARYGKDLPATAEIVLTPKGGEEKRYAMAKNLDDPVFGGVVPEVGGDATYHVAYDGVQTDEFEITTFVYPELERADAMVVPPAGTGQEAKRLEDTRSVSAMEGSEVTVEVTLNKPVGEARLEDKEGWSWPLTEVEGKERTYAVTFVPEESDEFRLMLLDEAERANKRPPKFTIRVKQNLPVQVAMVFPGRDATPSAVEEMGIEARLWDDLGVERYGAVYAVNDAEYEVELESRGEDKDGKERVGAIIDLEALKAKPDDAVMYYVWAEDIGPDGTARRVPGDMYFADVRPFENTFREQEAQAGEGESPPPGGEAGELLEKQREVIAATWNLMREGEKAKRDDREVVRESQEVIAGMAQEAAEKAEDAALSQAFVKASEEMLKAAGLLEVAVAAEGAGVKPSLEDAMPPEKSAYSELLKAREREQTITKAKPGQKGSGSPQKQKQMMNLELKQEEQRYEEEKMALEEPDAEQSENLQVLNRLSELARRQAELRERIEELEAALAEAETEEKREELARQLKRLQEEQEELVRDMDELRDRMDSEENQSRMAAEQEQLKESREQARQASEELKKGELDKAANSTARAQEDLEELRDEFQKKTSNQFAQEMRQMRREVREIEEREAAIREDLAGAGTPEGEDMAQQLERALENRQQAGRIDAQEAAVAELMERMREVSEAAEESEPLVSEKLYDAVREAEMHQVEEALDDAGEMLRMGRVAQARKAEEEAAAGIEELKEGIEKAANRVLGDEREALRMARAELDRLIEELEPELQGDEGQGARGERQEGEGQDGERGEMAEGRGEGEGARGEGEQEGRERGEGEQAQEGEQATLGAEGEGKEPGKGEGEGEQPGEGEGEGEGRGRGMAQGEQAGDGQGAGGDGRTLERAGQGMAQGEQPGEGQGAGSEGRGGAETGAPEGTGPGQGIAQGEQAGDGQGQGQPGGDRQGQEGGSATRGGGDDRGGGMGPGRAPLFFEEGGVAAEENSRPITGEGYREWTDRLRDVEEMLEDGEMRQLAARALDRAREMRREFTRNDAPPNQELVQRQVAGPLMELRDRVFEELARQDEDGSLVPLDRDPVPVRYRGLVRGYYERLGSGE